MSPSGRSPEHSTERSNERSLEERRRVLRAAFLRPIHLLILLIGGVFFAATLAWWIPPLTLVTYAALVFLASRDWTFERRVLEGRRRPPPPRNAGGETLSPERRAHWLPRTETRRKVEEALTAYRKVETAIEESDDVAREVLGEASPKLRVAADRLVDIAHQRESAAAEIRRAQSGKINEERAETLRELEDRVEEADAEISSAVERFLTLRTRAVQASIDTDSATRAAASELDSSLNELNLRLEALNATMSSPEEPPASR